MEKSQVFLTDTTHPDFRAFEASVRQRLAQRSTLPPDQLQGVERLGRLVHILRQKQSWSLDTLAAQTGLPWLWLALLEQGVLLPAELTPETVATLGQAFPLQQTGPDPGVLFQSLAADLTNLRLAAHETPAPDDAGTLVPPRLQEAQELREPQAESLAPPLRVLTTREGRAMARGAIPPGPRDRTEPVRDFPRRQGLAAAMPPAAAPPPPRPPRYYRYRTDDQLVTASVRVRDTAPIEVTIETQASAYAMGQWVLAFTREDGTELYRGTVVLQPSREQPGFWVSRVEVQLNEPWLFVFYHLPNTTGGLP